MKLNEESISNKMKYETKVEVLKAHINDLETQLEDLKKETIEKEDELERLKKTMQKSEYQTIELAEEVNKYKKRISNKHKLLCDQLKLEEIEDSPKRQLSGNINQRLNGKLDSLKQNTRQMGILHGGPFSKPNTKLLTLKDELQRRLKDNNISQHVMQISIDDIIKEFEDKETETETFEGIQDDAFMIYYENGELIINDSLEEDIIEEGKNVQGNPVDRELVKNDIVKLDVKNNPEGNINIENVNSNKVNEGDNNNIGNFINIAQLRGRKLKIIIPKIVPAKNIKNQKKKKKVDNKRLTIKKSSKNIRRPSMAKNIEVEDVDEIVNPPVIEITKLDIPSIEISSPKQKVTTIIEDKNTKNLNSEEDNVIGSNPSEMNTERDKQFENNDNKQETVVNRYHLSKYRLSKLDAKISEDLLNREFAEASRFRIYLQILNTIESLPNLTILIDKPKEDVCIPELSHTRRKKKSSNNATKISTDELYGKSNSPLGIYKMNNYYNLEVDDTLNPPTPSYNDRIHLSPDSLKDLNFNIQNSEQIHNARRYDFAKIRRRNSMNIISSHMIDTDDDNESVLSFRSNYRDNDSSDQLGLDMEALNILTKKSLHRASRALMLLRKIQQNPKQFKKTNRASLFQIHKFISKVYHDYMILNKDVIPTKLNTPFRLRNRIIDYAYQIIANKYGIRTVADKKFIQILLGIIKFGNRSSRAKLFGTFIGIWPMSQDELEFYLKGLNYMTNMLSSAPTISPVYNSSIQLVPFRKAMDFIREYFQQKLEVVYFTELKRTIQGLIKNPRDVNISNTGVVDIDEVMQIALRNYKYLLGVTQEHVRDIFTACDVTVLLNIA